MDDRTIAAIRALAAELSAERDPRRDDDYERGYATATGDAGRRLQRLLDQDGAGEAQAPRAEEQFGILLEDGSVMGTWSSARAAAGARLRSSAVRFGRGIVRRTAAYTPWTKVGAWSRFKRGDQVKVVHAFDLSDTHVGLEGVVQLVDGTRSYRVFIASTNESLYFWEDQLEMLRPAEPAPSTEATA